MRCNQKHLNLQFWNVFIFDFVIFSISATFGCWIDSSTGADVSTEFNRKLRGRNWRNHWFCAEAIFKWRTITARSKYFPDRWMWQLQRFVISVKGIIRTKIMEIVFRLERAADSWIAPNSTISIILLCGCGAKYKPECLAWSKRFCTINGFCQIFNNEKRLRRIWRRIF